jgi:ElaB/YqjD/DUF883 family membrane-anchored ribosome-binding protein
MADNITGINNPSSTGSTTAPGNGGFGGAAATGLAQTAQEYAGKVGEAAIQARDYVTDKVGAVGEKIKDIDFAEMTQTAKEYARKNPGQAILISAGVGLLLGILVRGRR